MSCDSFTQRRMKRLSSSSGQEDAVEEEEDGGGGSRLGVTVQYNEVSQGRPTSRTGSWKLAGSRHGFSTSRRPPAFRALCPHCFWHQPLHQPLHFHVLQLVSQIARTALAVGPLFIASIVGLVVKFKLAAMVRRSRRSKSRRRTRRTTRKRRRRS